MSKYRNTQTDRKEPWKAKFINATGREPLGGMYTQNPAELSRKVDGVFDYALKQYVDGPVPIDHPQSPFYRG